MTALAQARDLADRMKTMPHTATALLYVAARWGWPFAVAYFEGEGVWQVQVIAPDGSGHLRVLWGPNNTFDAGWWHSGKRQIKLRNVGHARRIIRGLVKP